MLNTLFDALISIGPWILVFHLALFFLYHSYLKLSGSEGDVKLFEKIGIGQWFRLLTGTIEALGAALLVAPTTRLFGALLLLATMGGAIATQFFLLKQYKRWREAYVVLALLVIATSTVA